MVEVAEENARDEADERRRTGLRAFQQTGARLGNPDPKAVQREERVAAVRKNVDVKDDQETRPPPRVGLGMRAKKAPQPWRARDRIRGSVDRRHRPHQHGREQREQAEDGQRRRIPKQFRDEAPGGGADRVARRERGGVPAHRRSGALTTGEIDRDREVVGPKRTERVSVRDREESYRDGIAVGQGIATRREGEDAQPEDELPARALRPVRRAARDTRNQPEDRKKRSEDADRDFAITVLVEIESEQLTERALRGRHRGRDDILKEDRAAQTRVSTSMSPSAPARRARSSASIQIFRITRGSVSPLAMCSISCSVKRRGSPIA